jgi:transposase-like protein
MIARGWGRKPTYDAQERARIVQEVQRQPDQEKDQTATWSLKLLEHALRKEALPTIGATTIGRISHEEGYSVQQDRIWCSTGTARTFGLSRNTVKVWLKKNYVGNLSLMSLPSRAAR